MGRLLRNQASMVAVRPGAEVAVSCIQQDRICSIFCRGRKIKPKPDRDTGIRDTQTPTLEIRVRPSINGRPNFLSAPGNRDTQKKGDQQ
jgi:hypothetical protein